MKSLPAHPGGKQVPVCWLCQPSGTQGAPAQGPDPHTDLTPLCRLLRAPQTGERRPRGFWKPLGPEPREGAGEVGG